MVPPPLKRAGIPQEFRGDQRREPCRVSIVKQRLPVAQRRPILPVLGIARRVRSGGRAALGFQRPESGTMIALLGCGVHQHQALPD
jgi:hypothetical protein